MRVGRVLYPIKALGPGERLGIWLQGCDRRCEGCANPELWEKEKGEMPLPMLVAMCKAAMEDYSLTGITISGGEPLLQAEELAELMAALRPVCDDILLFTGYTLENAGQISAEEMPGEKTESGNRNVRAASGRIVHDGDLNDDAVERVLSLVDVVVGGVYVREQNCGEILRGSSNQLIHYLNGNSGEEAPGTLRTKYEAYIETNRKQIDEFIAHDGIVAVGIHPGEFIK